MQTARVLPRAAAQRSQNGTAARQQGATACSSSAGQTARRVPCAASRHTACRAVLAAHTRVGAALRASLCRPSSCRATHTAASASADEEGHPEIEVTDAFSKALADAIARQAETLKKYAPPPAPPSDAASADARALAARLQALEAAAASERAAAELGTMPAVLAAAAPPPPPQSRASPALDDNLDELAIPEAAQASDLVQVLGTARARSRAAVVRLRALRDGLNGEIEAHEAQTRALDYVLRRVVADAAYYATLQRMQDAQTGRDRQA